MLLEVCSDKSCSQSISGRRHRVQWLTLPKLHVWRLRNAVNVNCIYVYIIKGKVVPVLKQHIIEFCNTIHTLPPLPGGAVRTTKPTCMKPKSKLGFMWGRCL